MLRPISVLDLLDTRGVIIDVRSEGEYFEAHIPTSTNIPLLSNAERVEVGTLYKQVGAEPAQQLGLKLVRPKLDQLLKMMTAALSLPLESVRWPNEEQWSKVFELVAQEILGIHFDDTDKSDELLVPSQTTFPEPVITQKDEVSSRPLVFYCWRGGARSKSMALFARALGFDAHYVVGGHKAFRNHVQNFLNDSAYPFKLCTLYGLTGCGKTCILHQWLKEGKPVIDLEGLAHHRGSAFGQLGIAELGRQKDFENNLFWEINTLLKRGEKVIFIEGESRRIGRCNLPENFLKAMVSGIRVKVSATIQERVKNILDEYVGKISDQDLQVEAKRSLDALKRRLGGEKHKELSQFLVERNYARFTEELLIHYYDKTYQFSDEPDDFYQVEISGAGDWPRLVASV